MAKMRRTRFTQVLAVGFACALALTCTAFAETISGSVTNSTTGKAAGGTTVTLVDPMGGMAEVATAKADSAGKFSFNAPPAKGPRLLRAERGGVNYFKMIPPGTDSAELSVYDAAGSVEGIKGAADVVRFQAENGSLEATEMFVVSNNSQPPRTLAASSTFEFVVPDGAKIDDVHAQAPNGQPITVEAKPAAAANHYAFSFALKPGDTKFQVAYHLPYSGQASISPRLTRDFEHYVVMTPVGMTFTAKDPKAYQGMDGQQPGANPLQVSLQATAGKEIAYTISGTGSYPDESEAAQSAPAGGGAPNANGRTEAARPGGGLGKPIDAPDGLAKYRWFILVGLMAVLVGGGIWTHERTAQERAATPAPVVAAQANIAAPPADRSAAVATPAAQPPSSGGALLAALKDELFTLELEHQQGKISQEEYGKARAALEQTIQRALHRSQS